MYTIWNILWKSILTLALANNVLKHVSFHLVLAYGFSFTNLLTYLLLRFCSFSLESLEELFPKHKSSLLTGGACFISYVGLLFFFLMLIFFLIFFSLFSFFFAFLFSLFFLFSVFPFVSCLFVSFLVFPLSVSDPPALIVIFTFSNWVGAQWEVEVLTKSF